MPKRLLWCKKAELPKTILILTYRGRQVAAASTQTRRGRRKKLLLERLRRLDRHRPLQRFGGLEVSAGWTARRPKDGSDGTFLISLLLPAPRKEGGDTVEERLRRFGGSMLRL